MIHLLKKELSELINKQMLIGLFATFLIIVMLGFMMTRTITESISESGTVSLIDLDDTEFTAEIVSLLEETGYTVRIVKPDAGTEDFTQIMEEQDWKSAAVITDGFSQKVQEEYTVGEIGSVSILNTTSAMTSLSMEEDSTSLVTWAVKQLLSEQHLGERMEFLADPVEVTPYTIANGKQAQISSGLLLSSLTLFDQLMPLVLFLLVVLTSQTIITAVAAEKTDKTLETLLSSPVPRTSVIGAKMLAALIVAVLYAAVYGAGMVATMFLTISSTAGESDTSGSLTDMVLLNKALSDLGLQIPFWGWILVIVQLLLTIFIALMASIILGALVQDAKGSQTASLPILIATMFPYILSMVSDIRLMEGPTQILLYLLPFTHTFIATGCLRFGQFSLFLCGLLYQAIFLAAVTVLAVKIYRSDILFIGKVKQRKQS